MYVGFESSWCSVHYGTLYMSTDKLLNALFLRSHLIRVMFAQALTKLIALYDATDILTFKFNCRCGYLNLRDLKFKTRSASIGLSLKFYFKPFHKLFIL